MQGSTLVKLIVVAAVLLFLWKEGLPWLQRQQHTATPTTGTSASTNCVFEARAASDYWGGTIGRFANPPYDMQAWDNFKAMVDGRIGRAGEKCSCEEDACKLGRQAMDELRGLVSDMDTSIRTSAPPPMDVVQRQEKIDNAINDASAAAERQK